MDTGVHECIHNLKRGDEAMKKALRPEGGSACAEAVENQRDAPGIMA